MNRASYNHAIKLIATNEKTAESFDDIKKISEMKTVILVAYSFAKAPIDVAYDVYRWRHEFKEGVGNLLAGIWQP